MFRVYEAPWDRLSDRVEHALLRAAEQDSIQAIVVGGYLADRRGRLLVLRRGPAQFMANKLEIPSGKVEHGESLQMALDREMLEETGMHISDATGPVDSFDFVSSSGKRTRQFNFLATPTLILPVRLCEEHSEYNWVDRANWRQYDFDEIMTSMVSHYFRIASFVGRSAR